MRGRCGATNVGRLAPGCKADFVMVDTRHPAMMPLREPLRSLIFVAAERAVRDVWVDGRQVVENQEVLGIDLPSALATLEAAQARSMERVPGIDWAGRSAAELSPMALDTVDDVAG